MSRSEPRILVTGAAGFLGWNLCRELRRRHPDAKIHGLDNLWTGRLRRDSAYDHLFVHDVAESELTSVYDYVYHLASPAAPCRYQEWPLRTIRANVDGLWRCLQRWVMPRGTVFLASSSEVYGSPTVSPQPESYVGQVSTTGPRACYDESKRLCETIMCDWHRTHPEQRLKIARLFNVYGPGTLPSDGRCMSNFVWQAMLGLPLTIHGTGYQTRAFTYVDNVIQGIVRLVEETPDEFIGPLNIGTDVETSVRSLATAVMAEVGHWHIMQGREWHALQPTYLPALPDDPVQRLPDLRMARDIIGWSTSRLIRHDGPTGGIQRTIAHFAEEYWREDMYHDPGKAPAEPAADAPEPAGEPAGADGAVGAGA